MKNKKSEKRSGKSGTISGSKKLTPRPVFDYDANRQQQQKRWQIHGPAFCDFCGNHLELMRELQREMPDIQDENFNWVGEWSSEKLWKWTNALNQKIAEKGIMKKCVTFDGVEHGSHSGCDGCICLDCIKKLLEPPHD